MITQGRVFEIRKWTEADPDHVYRAFYCAFSNMDPQEIVRAVYDEVSSTMPPSWGCCVTYRPDGVPDDFVPAPVGDAPEGWE